MFATTIDGQSASPTRVGRPRTYRVRSGEHLLVRVAVAVPRHVRLTALWLGISSGEWGADRKGRPIGMKPILAHSSDPLPAGVHTFVMHWRFPARWSGGALYLTTNWSSNQPPVDIAGAIAVFVQS